MRALHIALPLVVGTLGCDSPPVFPLGSGDLDAGTDASARLPTDASQAAPTDSGSPPREAALQDAALVDAAFLRGDGGLRGTIAYPLPSYPPENADSDDKAMLGKFLFWEEQVSATGTVACGTCHRPSAGGSDPRSALSSAALPGPDDELGTFDDIHGSPGVIRCNSTGDTIGAVTQVTGRKAPSYLDAMFTRQLFWDGRAECSHEDCPQGHAFEDPDNPGTFPLSRNAALENQAVGPPLSDVEMACEDATWSGIHTRLEAATPLALASDLPEAMSDFLTEYPTYPEMFAAAFGSDHTSGADDEINTRRFAMAIATHERRLRSNETPWDAWNDGDDTALSEQQLRGFDLFLNKADCEACHKMPLFHDGDFHFIGFHRPSWDPGREGVTPGEDLGAMRTPTLRNVGLREAGGLLHRGAGPGESLEEVLRLYNEGGLVDDPEVTAVPVSADIEPLELTDDELDDLAEFLRGGLTDPRVENELPPFDRPRLSTE